MKLEAWPRYVSRTTLLHFVCRYEAFKKVLDVPGSIVEAGVFTGKGLFTWLQLCSIFEPQNFTRKIIGFDTFEGFPEIHEMDKRDGAAPLVGDYASDSMEAMVRSVGRLAGEFLPGDGSDKVQLVKGDIKDTVPGYLAEHPHTVVSLLHLDADLYEPTRTALEHFLPRMPKGAVLLFDELNHPAFPGETTALLEEVGVREIRLRRFRFGTYISYAVLE